MPAFPRIYQIREDMDPNWLFIASKNGFYGKIWGD